MAYLETRKIDQLFKQSQFKKEYRIEENIRCICYVLHNSLPYSSGGYATRAHGLAKGLTAQGYKIYALTRPGFPSDTIDTPLQDVKDHNIDGIEYIRELVPFRNNNTIFSYMKRSIDVYEARFRVIKPQIVIAASFPLSALPAIVAAKKIGIPVFYEVRGLEEITKVSMNEAFKNTDEYNAKIDLETVTAKEADHVLTLTQAMKDEFVSRGISSEKIDLVPNSCDPSDFKAIPKNIDLTKQYGVEDDELVLGYVGSFVFYEGLDDLIRACHELKKVKEKFKLIIVGSEGSAKNIEGKITKELKSLIKKHDLSDHIILTGRVPFEKIADYYSLIDICVYPRKPLPVCEMVSPMKPLEALSLGKVVIASNVSAISEIITNGENGLLFNKGDVMSLVEKLSLVIKNPALRDKLGKNARAYIERERNWLQTVKKATAVIEKVIKNKMALNQRLPNCWNVIDPDFAKRCEFVDVNQWSLSSEVTELRGFYVQRFGEEAIERRIPKSNWARADICWQLTPRDLPTIDIGSGLGEFVNLFAINNPNTSITSVDTRDWDKYFDHTGRIQRVYKNIFELDESDARDIVTCFEVIEHLPPDRVNEAVNILRKISKKRLFVSVPFLEPEPMYKGHFTRFTEEKLSSLFPDATFTIFAKSTRHKTKVHAWILAEISFE